MDGDRLHSAGGSRTGTAPVRREIMRVLIPGAAAERNSAAKLLSTAGYLTPSPPALWLRGAKM